MSYGIMNTRCGLTVAIEKLPMQKRYSLMVKKSSGQEKKYATFHNDEDAEEFMKLL